MEMSEQKGPSPHESVAIETTKFEWQRRNYASLVPVETPTPSVSRRKSTDQIDRAIGRHSKSISMWQHRKNRFYEFFIF